MNYLMLPMDLSFDQVIVSVSICTKCQLVHRYIVKGRELAKKKGLDNELEGYWHNNMKVFDQGCHYTDIIDLPIVGEFVKDVE